MKKDYLKRRKSIELFKSRLKDYFIESDSELYDIKITPLGRVDLTITSNKFENSNR